MSDLGFDDNTPDETTDPTGIQRFNPEDTLSNIDRVFQSRQSLNTLQTKATAATVKTANEAVKGITAARESFMNTLDITTRENDKITDDILTAATRTSELQRMPNVVRNIMGLFDEDYSLSHQRGIMTKAAIKQERLSRRLKAADMLLTNTTNLYKARMDAAKVQASSIETIANLKREELEGFLAIPELRDKATVALYDRTPLSELEAIASGKKQATGELAAAIARAPGLLEKFMLGKKQGIVTYQKGVEDLKLMRANAKQKQLENTLARVPIETLRKAQGDMAEAAKLLPGETPEAALALVRGQWRDREKIITAMKAADVALKAGEIDLHQKHVTDALMTADPGMLKLWLKEAQTGKDKNGNPLNGIRIHGTFIGIDEIKEALQKKIERDNKFAETVATNYADMRTAESTRDAAVEMASRVAYMQGGVTPEQKIEAEAAIANVDALVKAGHGKPALDKASGFMSSVEKTAEAIKNAQPEGSKGAYGQYFKTGKVQDIALASSHLLEAGTNVGEVSNPFLDNAYDDFAEALRVRAYDVNQGNIAVSQGRTDGSAFTLMQNKKITPAETIASVMKDNNTQIKVVNSAFQHLYTRAIREAQQIWRNKVITKNDLSEAISGKIIDHTPFDDQITATGEVSGKYKGPDGWSIDAASTALIQKSFEARKAGVIGEGDSLHGLVFGIMRNQMDAMLAEAPPVNVTEAAFMRATMGPEPKATLAHKLRLIQKHVSELEQAFVQKTQEDLGIDARDEERRVTQQNAFANLLRQGENFRAPREAPTQDAIKVGPVQPRNIFNPPDDPLVDKVFQLLGGGGS